MIKWVAISAVISILGFFALSFFKQHDCNCRRDTARHEEVVIRNASMLYAAQEQKCPNMRLLRKGYMDKHKRPTDPWSTEYRIRCTYNQNKIENVIVVSAGQDQKFNTEDDILVPSPDE